MFRACLDHFGLIEKDADIAPKALYDKVLIDVGLIVWDLLWIRLTLFSATSLFTIL
jgi:hypothetical protein